MKEVIFGLHAVTTALEKRPDEISQLLVQKGRQDKRLQALLDLAASQGVAVTALPRDVLDEKASGRHQGVIAEVQVDDTPRYSEKQIPEILAGMPSPALILILDGVTDPHNLGACLRSADAAGVGLVIAPKDKAVGLTSVARKVACGAAETVPFVQVTNLARTLKQLQDVGIWLVGLAGEAEQMLYSIDLTGPVGIVMGAEGSGLRRLTRENCDFLAKLPMAGAVSSLNVSVATGISLFEAVRQRGA